MISFTSPILLLILLLSLYLVSAKQTQLLHYLSTCLLSLEVGCGALKRGIPLSFTYQPMKVTIGFFVNNNIIIKVLLQVVVL